MHLKHYKLESDRNFTAFEFVSEGNNGRIVKEVRFQQMRLPNRYNLAFGDKDVETGDFNDMTVTNNGDTETILATVAIAVYYFTEKHPKAWIYATGSTAARTRLYRMGINKYFEIMLESFTILGLYKNRWERFERNKNYAAFATQRKKR